MALKTNCPDLYKLHKHKKFYSESFYTEIMEKDVHYLAMHLNYPNKINKAIQKFKKFTKAVQNNLIRLIQSIKSLLSLCN